MKWLLRHWYIPVILLVVVLAFCVGLGAPAMELLRSEMSAVDAKHKAEEMRIEYGEAEAMRGVEAQYKETINAIDGEQRIKVDKLRARRKPGALAAELTRIGRKRKRERAAGGGNGSG